MGKRVLGCSFRENFSLHFCGEFIVPVQKSSGIMAGGGLCSPLLPHTPDPKGELLVSLPGQVSVAIPQSFKEFGFSFKLWQSACDTYNIKSTLGFQEKANYLDGTAPLRKQRREHILLCIHFTLRHITSQVPPVFHSSQNSARPPTHFSGQLADPEKQQRSSREEEASTACKAAPRGKELLAGHKEGQLRLALE